MLGKKIVEKPWGKNVLPPQFDVPAGKRVGEVWFEPPPELPDILVKYIFTSEKLSVQVHPSDEQAKALGESDRGKEECWLVIDAEPGATLGIGFKEAVDSGTIRRAALDGTIEDLMQWFPVKPGDFFYIPAGTVHAIGAGVSLVEIQQNSDITYRLYDYGRPRELHLERGLQVAKGVAHRSNLRQSIETSESVQLTDGPFFSVAVVAGQAVDDGPLHLDRSTLVIPVGLDVTIDDCRVGQGQGALAGKGEELRIAKAAGACLLVQHVAPPVSSVVSAPPR
nr:class I mannose-6-phosphate isomerase [Novosphingobium sp. ERN07]